MGAHRFVTIIPARGGSKRFPGKNIYPFAGKPLIAHSIEFSKQSSSVKATFVSTDSQDIKDVALQYGATVINRPKELGGDFVSSADVMKDAVKQLINSGVDFDFVILLQPTNPLRPNGLIEKAIELMINNKSTSLFTVSRNDKKLGKIVNNSFVPLNYHFGQRSQDLDLLFYENGLLYITHKDLLLKGVVMDSDSIPMVIDHIFGEVDIDTKDDLVYGEYVLSQYGC